ncbi:CD40 ligand [Ascaphus truei]|uniref:CD40 ligand n=1 Tax=Ascaphus truei TaxID=8439 RepID=UPI003F599ACB
MNNAYNQTAPRHPSYPGSPIKMKMTMCIFTLFFVAQIIGTALFGFYLCRRLDKFDEEKIFTDDYRFLRTIQKCMKGGDIDPTLLNCKEVISKMRTLIAEVTKMDVSGETHAMLREGNGSTAAHREGEKVKKSKEEKNRSPLAAPLVGVKSSEQKEEKETSPVAAHLVGQQSSSKEVLQWMQKGYSSMLDQMTYANGKLRVETPGVYYVYAQVSFCMNSTQSPRAPFVQYIFLSRPPEADKLLVKGANTFISPTAECALHSIQQGGVFTLRHNDQLFVNVTDSSRVNYSPGFTYFGMFRL